MRLWVRTGVGLRDTQPLESFFSSEREREPPFGKKSPRIMLPVLFMGLFGSTLNRFNEDPPRWWGVISDFEPYHGAIPFPGPSGRLSSLGGAEENRSPPRCPKKGLDAPPAQVNC